VPRRAEPAVLSGCRDLAEHVLVQIALGISFVLTIGAKCTTPPAPQDTYTKQPA
jgi:hypothetical protein